MEWPPCLFKGGSTVIGIALYELIYDDLICTLSNT